MPAEARERGSRITLSFSVCRQCAGTASNPIDRLINDPRVISLRITMKRLSVWLSEQQEADIIELSGGAGTKRGEWLRQAIDTAIDTARHPERITIVPAQGDQCVADIEAMLSQITGLEGERDTLTGENLTLEQDRTEALQRVSECETEIITLNRLLDERRDEVSWLRGQVALLNERPPALLPEQAGPGRAWWKFWRK